MIDIKTLSKVLGQGEVTGISTHKDNYTISNNEIRIRFKSESYIPVFTDKNIYELAFLCKLWASNKGYLIYSVPSLSIIKTNMLEYIMDFPGTNEVKTIFEACNWLDNYIEGLNNDNK